MRPRSLAAPFLLSLCLLAGGCSQSFFRQSISEALQPATPEQVAAVHQPQALRDDLDALVKLHDDACPDPYLRTRWDTILATRDRLKASITAPMHRREFLPLVMEMQAAYGVDHIVQYPPQEDLLAYVDSGGLLLPFRAALERDELAVFAVSACETQLEPGDRIVTVGGAPAAALIGRLRSLVPGESERFQNERIRESFRAFAWAAGVTLPIDVQVRAADGSLRSITLQGAGRDARRDERVSTAVAASVQASAAATGEMLVDEPPFRCTIVDHDIALIDFPTMSGSLGGQWDTFLDHAITAANARHCAGLIVDIRRNGGGDSSLGNALLSHLTSKPYRMAGGMIWRRSEAGYESFAMCVKPFWRWLLPVALPIVMPEYAHLANGENYTGPSEPESEPMRSPSFTGPTCLLIGESTFSSAMMLADAARTYDLMTTVGTPTGGIPTSLGELGFFELPNSRIRVQFCQKKFIRASGDLADGGPVVPHITVPAVEGVDAPLMKAIEEIRRRGTPAAIAS